MASHSFAEVYDQIYASCLEDEDESASLERLGAMGAREMLLEVGRRAARVEVTGVERLRAPGNEEAAKTVQTLRETGARAFQKRDYPLSVQAYSQLIEACSSRLEDGQKDLVRQGYASRSAVLQRAEEWGKCLNDSEMALSLTEEAGAVAAAGATARHLLLDRRARSLAALGKTEESKKAFGRAIEAVEESKDMPDKLRDALLGQMKREAGKLDENNAKAEEKRKERKSTELERRLESSHSDAFSSLSSSTSPKYAGPDRGRILEATRDIRAGELIAFEPPLVPFAHCSRQNSSNPVIPRVVSRVCHHCLSQLDPWVFYPSTEVFGVRFCSPGCLKDARLRYHRHEAYILSDFLAQQARRQVETSGCLFLAFRAVVSAPWEMLEEEEGEHDCEFGTREGEEVKEGDAGAEFEFLRSLVGHEGGSSAEERVRIAVRAATLAKCLEFTGYFKERGAEKEDGEMTVLRRLYDAQFGIAHNVHTVYAPAGEVSGGIPLAPVGSAVYRAVVLSNHSCCQNTAKFYFGGRMALVAKRGVKRGEEVTNTYGPHHSNMTKEERRGRLREDYKFECGCEACRGDYPTLEKMQQGGPPLKKSLSKQLDKLLSAYKRAFSAGDYESALSACESYLSRLDQLEPHNRAAAAAAGEVALDSCWWALVLKEQDSHFPK